ncbi:MAG: nucleotidyl transferase AbiEii/AbiGii toxin family protein, partial [Stackebrandtia sp.]
PDGWLLKGGQALLVRYPDARHSRDIDLCGTTTTSLDEAVAALERAAALDLQDHLRFSLRSRDDRLEGNGTTRLRFDVRLGGRVIPNGISADVVVGRHPIGQPTRKQLESAVPLEWLAGYPIVALYPAIDHVADKVCAMYEKHGTDQIASTRYRDLVDLILIALREPLDGRELHLALHAEVTRRTARGTHLRLPVSFTIPGPAWPAGYRAAAAAVAGLVDYRTIEPAAVLARTLLDPLLGEDNPPAHWDPDQLR